MDTKGNFIGVTELFRVLTVMVVITEIYICFRTCETYTKKKYSHPSVSNRIVSRTTHGYPKPTDAEVPYIKWRYICM